MRFRAVSIFNSKVCLLLAVATTATINAEECCYPPACYEELAASYEQLSAAYEQLAYDNSCCGRFAVGADYLYWRPASNVLDYAMDGIGTIAQGTVYHINPNYESGYRVTAGYEFPCNDWLLSFSWINFHSFFSQTTTPRPGLTLFATMSNPTSATLFTTLTRADASWKLRYRSLSGQFSYIYRMRCGLSLTPSIGVLGDYMNDDFEITYFQAAAPTTGRVSQKQSLRSVGPMFALGSDWNFFQSVSLYSNFSWTPLWTSSSSTFIYDVIQAANTNDINVKESGNPFIQRVDMAMGVKLGCRIAQRFGVVFAVGWEAICWFDVQDSIYFLDNARDGTIARTSSNLTLSGLVARMNVLF
jgi:hypothetical protein